MKILVINVVYEYGSTGVIVKNLCDYYKEAGNDVFVISGRGKRHSGKDYPVYKLTSELESKFFHFLSLFSGNLYGGMPFSTKKIIKKIKAINPDVVHLHCINGFFVNLYKLLSFLKEAKIKTILTNHAEFMMTANCGYTLSCEKWKNFECKSCDRVCEFAGKFALNKTHKYYLKLKESLENFSTLKVTCVSPWLTSRIKSSPLYSDVPVNTILNPVCVNESNNINPFVDALNRTKKAKVALFICTQLDNMEKGFTKFRSLAKEMIDSDYLFILVGSNYNFGKDENNIICFGPKTNSELSSYYKYADVTLLLSMRETFSMVAAESQCNGCPVVGYLSGGPETICLPDYSRFVDYGNNEAIREILLAQSFSFNSDERKRISELATEKFNLRNIGDQFLKLW